MFDNYELWKIHDAEMEEKLSRLPRCGLCYQRIQDEYCFRVNGEYFHEECFNETFRITVEEVLDV